MRVFPADIYVSSLQVEDGGRAVASALTLSSGVYNVVDDEPFTKRAFADGLARAARRKFYPSARATGAPLRRRNDVTDQISQGQ